MYMTILETCLSFTTGSERFAVNVTQVLEVLQKQPITAIPNAPESILGIINFRGEIVPVYDFRSILKFPKRDENQKSVVIIFTITGSDNETLTVAASSDNVKDVLEIDTAEIKPLPQFGYNFNSEFIKGIYQKNDISYIMLDINKVFSINEITAISEDIQNQNLAI